MSPSGFITGVHHPGIARARGLSKDLAHECRRPPLAAPAASRRLHRRMLPYVADWRSGSTEPTCRRLRATGPRKPSDLHTQPGQARPNIDESLSSTNPADAWEDGAYIRVHGQGSRRLVVGRTNVPQRCWDAGPTSDCDVLLADHFGRAVLERLRAEHALGDERFGGIGRGVCGRSTDELDYERSTSPSAYSTGATPTSPSIPSTSSLKRGTSGITTGYPYAASNAFTSRTPPSETWRMRSSTELSSNPTDWRQAMDALVQRAQATCADRSGARSLGA